MMVEQLLEQRIAELEFRTKTLEKAVLALAERLAKMEYWAEAKSKRFLTDILKEGEIKQ